MACMVYVGIDEITYFAKHTRPAMFNKLVFQVAIFRCIFSRRKLNLPLVNIPLARRNPRYLPRSQTNGIGAMLRISSLTLWRTRLEEIDLDFNMFIFKLELTQKACSRDVARWTCCVVA